MYVAPDSINGGNLSMGGDVDAYGYLAYNRFFPSIERDRLRAMAEAIMLDPSGDPTDPTANADPYVAWQPIARFLARPAPWVVPGLHRLSSFALTNKEVIVCTDQLVYVHGYG